MKRWGIVWVFLYSFQTYLILTTHVHLHPEMYFFPWLVSKGLLPYRDFFDHHGFFLYYLLAPFSQNESYVLLTISYVMILSLNLALVLLILQQITSRSGVFVGGFIYVLVAYFINENFLWYETGITSLYLVAFLLSLQNPGSFLQYMIGVLVGLSSLMKPTAGILVLPLCMFHRSWRPLLSFCFVWVGAFGFFFSQQGGYQFFQGMFLFNSYLVRSYRPDLVLDTKFLLFSIVLILYSLIILLQASTRRCAILTGIFLCSSCVFLSTGYGKLHQIPIFSFFPLLIGLVIGHPPSRRKYLFLCILFFYAVLLTKKVFIHREYLHTYRISWQEDMRAHHAERYFKHILKPRDTLYVYDNHPELYMALEKIPPTYFPLTFPLIDRYFSYQDHVIDDLRTHRVRYIYVPVPIDPTYISYTKIWSYIQSRYRVLYEGEGYRVYTHHLLQN